MATNYKITVPIYAKLEGQRAPKKRSFLVKFLQKQPKNGIYDPFFFVNFACDAKFLIKDQTTVLKLFWEGSETQFGRPKKLSTKLFLGFSRGVGGRIFRKKN